MIGTKFTDTDFGELGLIASAGYNTLAGFGKINIIKNIIFIIYFLIKNKKK